MSSEPNPNSKRHKRRPTPTFIQHSTLNIQHTRENSYPPQTAFISKIAASHASPSYQKNIFFSSPELNCLEVITDAVTDSAVGLPRESIHRTYRVSCV